jgi:flotillin
MSEELQARPREEMGWRTGRPVEDPNKTKRWGFVTAKPSEFLVHCRRGAVLPTSGQGATCFKWPWDSVAVVPTSFQRLRFTADQVTSEKVGVEVTGIAVYRIAEPKLAFRVLNFSYPERAQEKLERTMTEMLIGATRRLVANLTVNECLQKRKAALADELVAEIAPVVGGRGRPSDFTEQGWGVVLDTVEIQEVKILSPKVFAAMQEPFRAKLDRQSREARADAEQYSALAEAESHKQIQAARLAAEAEVRVRKSELARQEAEAQSRDEIRRLELAHGEEAARVEDAVERRALERKEIEADLQNHEHKLLLQKGRDNLLGTTLDAKLARSLKEAEVDSELGKRRAEVAMAQALAQKEAAIARARILTAEKLPELAAAIGARFGEVKVTQIGGGDSPFSSIAQALGSVLALVKEE